ncbi:polyketide cyclase dehydrase protein [Rutstroemia sp. NJR-2017a BBW]|nr:polyketide cyclase dehydrase protein [Rutstroemia sp. NJR-2017a BBW]
MVIITKVEIAASPEVVRRVLLDFPKIPEWHTGLVKTITPLDNDDPVSVGKKLHCVMEGFTFDSEITACLLPNCFSFPLFHSSCLLSLSQLLLPLANTCNTDQHPHQVRLARTSSDVRIRTSFLPLRTQHRYSWQHDFHTDGGIFGSNCVLDATVVDGKND